MLRLCLWRFFQFFQVGLFESIQCGEEPDELLPFQLAKQPTFVVYNCHRRSIAFSKQTGHRRGWRPGANALKRVRDEFGDWLVARDAAQSSLENFVVGNNALEDAAPVDHVDFGRIVFQ